MPNIRNEAGYLASIWDWSAYNDCFGGTSIRITDVDGLVERKGHFLLIETKKPHEEIPTGQQILFSRLAKQANWHVLILYGETDQPEAYQFWDFNAQRKPATLDTIKMILRRWFDYANR